uniref:Uncharacterized protein n=1 Tax=Anguilla anguilla TaxID=7936 RepID=A0A0E9WI53_ANGAN
MFRYVPNESNYLHSLTVFHTARIKGSRLMH